MVTPIACKRSAMLEDDLLMLDPHIMKRYRFDCGDGEDDDGAMITPEMEEVLASAVTAAASSSSSSADAASSIATAAAALVNAARRRRPHEEIDNSCDVDDEAPSEKRFRHVDGRTDVEIIEWAETLVRALQGCPSIDEAIRRCSKVLGEFSAEVRQTALRDLQQEGQLPQASDETPSRSRDDQQDFATQEQMMKAMKKAIVYLMNRCRKLQQDAHDASSLREALEKAQENVSRLQHSNEILRGHLKVHMDAYRNSLHAFSCP